MTHTSTGNQLVDIETLDQVVEYWPFLAEGLGALNETVGNGKPPVTEDAYLKLIFYILSKNPGFGRIITLQSKNNKLLAYGIIFDNTEFYCRPSAVIYCVYSNKKCPAAVQELQDEAERWAREKGFEELHAVSRRITGAALRLFEKKWGFRRAAIVFKKVL